jgi:hypothetical protein
MFKVPQRVSAGANLAEGHTHEDIGAWSILCGSRSGVGQIVRLTMPHTLPLPLRLQARNNKRSPRTREERIDELQMPVRHPQLL